MISSLLLSLFAACSPAWWSPLVEEDSSILVLNKSEASVSILSAATGKEVHRIETGVGPHEVAVSQDGSIAVVTNYGTTIAGNTLTVLDLKKGSVVKTIDLKPYHRPHGIEFMGDGRVVVTAEREKSLLVVDLDTGVVDHAIGTDQETSHMVALHPTEPYAYVANIGSGSVSIVDLEEGQLLEVVTTGAGAEGIDVAPDGEEVWISNRDANTLTILDALAFEPIAEVACATFPIRVKFTPNGKHVLISNSHTGDVAVFDRASRQEVQRIKMNEKAVADAANRLFSDRFGESPVPVGILIPPEGHRAYVANTNADIVTVLDLGSWKIVDRLRGGREPDGLGYSPLPPPVQENGADTE